MTETIEQEHRDMAERVLNVMALYADQPANSVRDWIAKFLATELQSVHAKAVEQTWNEALDIGVACHNALDKLAADEALSLDDRVRKKNMGYGASYVNNKLYDKFTEFADAQQASHKEQK